MLMIASPSFDFLVHGTTRLQHESKVAGTHKRHSLLCCRGTHCRGSGCTAATQQMLKAAVLAAPVTTALFTRARCQRQKTKLLKRESRTAVVVHSQGTQLANGEGIDSKLSMVLAGFSFDSYTEINPGAGIWMSDGSGDSPGIGGVKAVLLSPQFVRNCCSGILRVRVVAVKGLQGVPVAGSVAVKLSISVDTPWAMNASGRSSTCRGVLSGETNWCDQDESLYLYVPAASQGVQGSSQHLQPVLHIEIQSRDIFDSTVLNVVGRAKLPFEKWSSSRLHELTVELETNDENASNAEVPGGTLQLQTAYDKFGADLFTVEPEKEGMMIETLEDITPEIRERKRLWGTAVPGHILNPNTEKMTYADLQQALRRRALPCLGENEETLLQRYCSALEAEERLRNAGGLLQSMESLRDSAMETMSGDIAGALGAGLWSGATEVPGVEELFKGDFMGAFGKRQEVVELAMTEDGRKRLQQKVAVATKRARQQAMLRLANGMELMSVRRGAWKMLEQAVLDETDGSESFGDYEQLVYLEAPSTSTECWVWRLQRCKRLLVTFRGTCEFGDVLTDISATPKDLDTLGCIHSGFSEAYDSIRDAVKAALSCGCDGDASSWEILFTGHSLGGALATLASFDIAQEQRKEECAKSPFSGADITVCTFGSPRVGNARFCALYNDYVPRCWRIYGKSDIIPRAPPTSFWGFRHAGIAVELDPEDSKLIVHGRSPGLWEQAAAEAQRGNPNDAEPMDIWSAFDGGEISELQNVLGAGTQAVGEHMEDNYFRRIQECLGADLQSAPIPENMS